MLSKGKDFISLNGGNSECFWNVIDLDDLAYLVIKDDAGKNSSRT